jgi:hypothetical protein
VLFIDIFSTLSNLRFFNNIQSITFVVRLTKT